MENSQYPPGTILHQSEKTPVVVSEPKKAEKETSADAKKETEKTKEKPVEK